MIEYQIPITDSGDSPMWKSNWNGKFYLELCHGPDEITLRQVEPPYFYDSVFWHSNLLDYGFMPLVEG